MNDLKMIVPDTSFSLRGHHILCLHHYAGKGYSPAYTAHFDAIIVALHHGASITLTIGPDHLCHAPAFDFSCPMRANETCREVNTPFRDQAALQALRRHVPQNHGWKLGANVIFTPALSFVLRKAATFGAFLSACSECKWHPFCQTLQQNRFAGCRFFMKEPCPEPT